MKPVIACAVILASGISTSAITIDTIHVGDPGNPSRSLAVGQGFGGVGYSYEIGKYEITVSQYTAFLNAVAATDTYALYNPQMATDLTVAGISRTGTSGGYTYAVIGSPNKPVTYVSYGDAIRFVNWIANGQPGLNGPSVPQDANSTEDGSYFVNGITHGTNLPSQRKAGAVWFLPNINEWNKAAFYQPSNKGGNYDGYWDYPTRTNSDPFSDQPPGTDAPDPSNSANFFSDDRIANGYNDGYAVTSSALSNGTQNLLTDVGSYPMSKSYYGTFDQAGNVFEWTEANSVHGNPAIWGGSFETDSNYLRR